MSDDRAKTGGLGRGLSALLPAAQNAPAVPSPGQPRDAASTSQPAAAAAKDVHHSASSLREIPLDEIAPNPRQPRVEFDDAALEDLAASIRVAGVLQPVVVRRLGAGYQLVMGERRVRAARRAGLRMIPAVVRETADQELLRDALIENVQRQDLNPIEEAVALRALIDEHSLTHDDVASRIGRSRAAVTNALRLLSLAEPVQRRIAAGTLSAAHGRAIAALADHATQERIATRVSGEQMSVRQTENLVRTLSSTGGAAITERARSARPQPAAGILEVEHRLAAMLDTRVRVEAGRRGRGRIVVEFADEEDLGRIFRSIAREQ